MEDHLFGESGGKPLGAVRLVGLTASGASRQKSQGGFDPGFAGLGILWPRLGAQRAQF